jgi:hypothetical protein
MFLLHSVSLTMISRVILFRETVALESGNRTRVMSTIWGVGGCGVF